MKTAVVLDRRYEAHDPGPRHPESPLRIRAIAETLEGYQRAGLARLDPRVATHEEIALNHDVEYIARVAASEQHEHYAFDADTTVSPASFATARLAVGGCLAMLDAIVAGEATNGFAFVRPPGHHAEMDRAMGFCLFNNVAIGARYLRARHGIGRILIVDWDVHHGNGTQASCWSDPDVLYASTHQYPFYPGTGAAEEVGDETAVGRTVNVPLPAGCGDDEYVAVFERILVPVAEQFRPEFVLISAGFDAHARDPLAGMRVTEHGFRAMTRLVMRIAERHAAARLAAVLEGGYDMQALRTSVPAVLDELAGATLAEMLPTPRPDEAALEPSCAVHARYWELVAPR